MSTEPSQTQRQPTDDEISMAGRERGDAAKGDTTVSDGEVECADCGHAIPTGQPLYWSCSGVGGSMECDPYCAACTIQYAVGIKAMVDEIDREFAAPDQKSAR